VLEAGQPVRQGAHVAAALDVVLAAQRVARRCRSGRRAGQQREVDQATTLSTALWCSVMPRVQQIIALSALAKAWASSRIARPGRRLALGVLERVRLDLGLVGLEALGGARDERLVLAGRPR
jgi:hypothetical protein